MNSLQIIASNMSEATGFTPEFLFGENRERRVVQPRHLAFYLMSTLTGLSGSRIGQEFGFDHTSILHACAAVKTRIDMEPAFAEEVENWCAHFRLQYGDLSQFNAALTPPLTSELKRLERTNAKLEQELEGYRTIFPLLEDLSASVLALKGEVEALRTRLPETLQGYARYMCLPSEITKIRDLLERSQTPARQGFSPLRSIHSTTGKAVS